MKTLARLGALVILVAAGCGRADRSGSVEPRASARVADEVCSMTSIAFSPSGATIATAGTRWDGGANSPEITLRDARTLRPVRVIPQAKLVQALAFSPDGKALAAATGDYRGVGATELFDPSTGDKVKSIPGSTGWVHGLAFSPDGQTLVTSGSTSVGSSGGYLGGTVTRWDLATGKEVPAEGWKVDTWRAVAFAPSGKTYAAGGGSILLADKGFGLVCAWDAATGRQLWAEKGHTQAVECLAFSPDGSTVASGGMDGNVIFRDAATGKQQGSYHLSGRPFARALSIAYSPDGKMVAVGYGSYNRGDRWGEVRRYGNRGEPFWERPICIADGPVTSVAFSPDGKALAAGDADGTLRVWDEKDLMNAPPDLKQIP